LATLTAQTRHSGAEPTSTQVTSLSELDNIDIFDFFNLPKVCENKPAHTGGQVGPLLSPGPSTLGDGRGMPDPESDWLRYGTYN
jgi:hypothetical protein